VSGCVGIGRVDEYSGSGDQEYDDREDVGDDDREGEGVVNGASVGT
jgi:hypothetical protein